MIASLHATLGTWAAPALIALHLGLSLGGVLVALRGRDGAPIGLGAAARSVVLAAGAFGVVSVLAVALGASFFFVVHLAWWTTFAVAPAAALRALFAPSATRAVRGLGAVTLAVAVPALAWSRFVEPFLLVVERVSVPVDGARALPAPLRVAVLADIQCARVTERERRAVALAMDERPDLILIPGDLMQIHPRVYDERAAEFRALLAPLEAPLGVWFVHGNVDWPGRVERVFEGTNVRVLSDRVVDLEHGGRRVTLGGVDLSWYDPRSAGVVRELETRPGEDDLRLLVAHMPDAIDALARPSRVDLLVAGHTHGGQVRLPFFGPPITLSSVPRRVAAGGLHELDGRRVYVSRGIGAERGEAPLVRFLCPPEVTLLELGEAPATE